MRIWNDGPGRIVLVTLDEPEDAEPFASSTRLGQSFEELLGAPVSTWFATAAVMPVLERRSMARHVYGYEARNALAERRIIVVGKEAATLLDVPVEPLMIWQYVKWKVFDAAYGYVDAHHIPAVTSAAFPSPSARSAWWRDPENVDVAKQWIEEQAHGK